MPSQGLMIGGGIGEGLLQGVKAFQDQRRLSMDDERAQRQDKLANAGLLLQANKEGYSFDPSSGLLEETPQGKATREADLKEKIAHAGYFDAKAKEKPEKAPDPFKVAKLAEAYKKDMDPDVSRAGNFGQISSKLISAQALKRLATDSQGNINNLPAAQQEEMALGMAKMLGGAAGTDARIHALVPKSAVGDYAKLKSWLTNEPQGANQQAFTKYMLDTINRESDLAQDQLNEIRLKREPAHSAFKKMDPDTYQALRHSYGLDEYDNPQGLLAKKNSSQYPGAPKIGTAVDGHVYQGGDPNDQASWK